MTFANSVKDNFLEGLDPLIQEIFSQALGSASDDAREFFEDLAEVTVARGQLLAEGKITKPEFDALMKMQAASIELHAITAQGIAVTEVERFRIALISLLVSSVKKAL